MKRGFRLAVVFAMVFSLLAVPSVAGAEVDESTDGLWELSVVPGVPNWPDPSAGSTGVELGVKFVTAEDTWVVGVRFYKGVLNTGTHLGTLWTVDGSLLATGTFNAETASGWQDLRFDQPVPISPSEVYVASYFSPTANYSAVNEYFDTALTTGPITAIAGVGAEVNGVFRYSNITVYPDMSFRNSNYWVTPLWTASLDPTNAAPTVAADNASVTVNEGDSAGNTGTVSDPDGDTVGLSADVGAVVNNNDGTWSWSFATSDGSAESQTVTIDADDGNGGTAETSFSLTVNNVAPSVDAITVPADPVDINDQPVTGVSAAFSDPADTNDEPYTCSVDYDDGGGPQAGTVAGTTCSGPDQTYAEAGVYAVTVTVTDKDGDSGSATATEFIVIFDPSGGFVTGGGWIDSPADACPAFCNDATGRANFGFVSKYKKGAGIPSGNTQFNFTAGDLNFHSDEYQWLVINQGGSRAQYKGSGTINGDPGPGDGYEFMIWAQDLDPTGDDTFRIKIWYEDAGEVVVYDNGTDQALGGGNIKVHTGK